MSSAKNVTTVGAIYNPLTDDALCFKLMVKHKVSVDFTDGKFNPVRCQAFYNQKELRCKQDKNPNKAICLAIIEAHKDG